VENYILSFIIGYLYGLGFLGAVFLIYVIRKAGKKSSWPAWGINLIVGLHYIAGLAAIGHFPLVYFKNQSLVGMVSFVDVIIFGVTFIFMLFITLWIAHKKNSIQDKD